MITEQSLKLFHKAAKELPAYKDYLKKHRTNTSEIKTLDDFNNIPLSSKKEYLQLYNHKDLVWSDAWNNLLDFCATSGSTGEPYYFPRNEALSERASYMAEEFLNNSSYGHSPTLVIMGFGMGVWIGGIFTMRAFEIAALRNKHPISVLPTGYNKKEIFKALRKLSPEFNQTIIAGYPPFIKELIDEAPDEGVDLKKLNVRFMFAAEAFTETYRKYVCDSAGIKDPLRDTLNIYGTADLGAMAYETPLSILIRQIALEEPLLYKDIFGQIEKTPTLAQYNPKFVEFEEVDGEVVLTSDAALPLIRYAVGDHGGVYQYSELEALLKRHKINLAEEIKKAGIEKTVSKRPFVYVYERNDLSTTLHGIIIYPEFIKEALLQPKLTPAFTERFTMSTKTDIHHNQFLQINLELQKDIKPKDELERRAHAAIMKSLIAKSSEFAEVSRSRDSKNLVQIVLWPNGHPRYFPAGVKQKWVEKT